MLHDKYLPAFHFSEKHNILISARASAVSEQIANLNVSDSWIIRALLALRGIPRKTSTGIEEWKKMGFVVLEQHPDKEIILGLVGQFWKPSGNIQPVTAEEFSAFGKDGFVKATWSFEIIPAPGNKIVLETETRILGTNENVRKRFGRYWFFIRPFSGLIRMEMLKVIKRKAEQVIKT